MSKDFLYPLRRIHGYIHDTAEAYSVGYSLYKKFKKEYNDKRRINPKTVFLVLTPEHTNLGDHAIAYAETQLLVKAGIDYVEITGKQLAIMNSSKCLHMMNGHPILVNGGGNLGTLWFDVEQLMRAVVRANPKSPIFILPNTIYYENTPYGEQEYDRSRKIYNAHNNLHFFARENISFCKMKEAYSSAKLVPDMVLSLNWCGENVSRSGCLLCMRNDRERLCSEYDYIQLIKILQTEFGDNLHFTDMHSASDIAVEDRNAALMQKCMEFQNAELVITDRLHGMIFAAITGTPCIVINSRSPKIIGCYEWIKNLPYICFCDNPSTVLEMLKKQPITHYTYENDHLMNYYNDMISYILEKI